MKKLSNRTRDLGIRGYAWGIVIWRKNWNPGDGAPYLVRDVRVKTALKEYTPPRLFKTREEARLWMKKEVFLEGSCPQVVKLEIREIPPGKYGWMIPERNSDVI